jgi:hypothetical protein
VNGRLAIVELGKVRTITHRAARRVVSSFDQTDLLRQPPGTTSGSVLPMVSNRLRMMLQSREAGRYGYVIGRPDLEEWGAIIGNICDRCRSR